MLGHYDQHLGECTVGTPQLGSVHDVLCAVFREGGHRGQTCGVGADFGLGKGERADLSSSAARQVFFLGFVRTKELQWLRHSDGLVGAQQGSQVAVTAAQEFHDLCVFELVEAQSAILGWNLHSKGAHFRELGDMPHVVLATVIHLDGVPSVPQEDGELFKEDLEFGTPLGTLWVRVDELKLEVSEKQLLHKAGVLPGGFPGFFGNSP